MTGLLQFGFETSGANFDETGAYRLRLWRRWGRGGYVCWVMLNPSTADHTVNDPTVRKCIAFSKQWGFGGLEVVNVFALRSTDPKALYPHHDPIGPGNDSVISSSAAHSSRVVAAWGNHGALHVRSAEVRKLLVPFGAKCLGMTKLGQPKHPLYIPYSVEPVIFS